MIDTDKYEGYYPAWVREYGDVVKLVYPNHEAPSLDADQRLISDAPLILQALIDERAEVERLREENELMVTYLRYMRDGELTDKDWLSVNELIGEEE